MGKRVYVIKKPYSARAPTKWKVTNVNVHSHDYGVVPPFRRTNYVSGSRISFGVGTSLLCIGGIALGILAIILWIYLYRDEEEVIMIEEFDSPVVVTSATHTAPGGYPVTQLPPPGYPPNPPNVYSPAPYPAQTTGNVTVQMPMPQPGMPTHGVTPYPPMPQPVSMNPPSYDVAVANPGPSVIPSSYEKQAPYNPTYGQ